VTVVITNLAADPEAPPQVLAFNLVQGPTNAALAPATGVFTWRPSVHQADSTNHVEVSVSDNGSPSLTGTNSFVITVAPLNRPRVSSIAAGAGLVSLAVAGDPGPDYTLLTSTNLSDWQALLTTNPPILPVTLVVTNRAAPQQYYRIQLGP